MPELNQIDFIDITNRSNSKVKPKKISSKNVRQVNKSSNEMAIVELEISDYDSNKLPSNNSNSPNKRGISTKQPNNENESSSAVKRKHQRSGSQVPNTVNNINETLQDIDFNIEEKINNESFFHDGMDDLKNNYGSNKSRTGKDNDLGKGYMNYKLPSDILRTSTVNYPSINMLGMNESQIVNFNNQINNNDYFSNNNNQNNINNNNNFNNYNKSSNNKDRKSVV